MTLIVEVNIQGFDYEENVLAAEQLAEALAKRGGGVFQDEFISDETRVYAQTLVYVDMLKTYAEGFLDGLKTTYT
jgi:hypothetical protein